MIFKSWLCKRSEIKKLRLPELFYEGYYFIAASRATPRFARTNPTKSLRSE